MANNAKKYLKVLILFSLASSITAQLLIPGLFQKIVPRNSEERANMVDQQFEEAMKSDIKDKNRMDNPTICWSEINTVYRKHSKRCSNIGCRQWQQFRISWQNNSDSWVFRRLFQELPAARGTDPRRKSVPTQSGWTGQLWRAYFHAAINASPAWDSRWRTRSGVVNEKNLFLIGPYWSLTLWKD